MRPLYDVAGVSALSGLLPVEPAEGTSVSRFFFFFFLPDATSSGLLSLSPESQQRTSAVVAVALYVASTSTQ